MWLNVTIIYSGSNSTTQRLQSVIGLADTQSNTLMGGTPLMFASVMGQTEIVKWLLEVGCDINAQDENNKLVSCNCGKLYVFTEKGEKICSYSLHILESFQITFHHNFRYSLYLLTFDKCALILISHSFRWTALMQAVFHGHYRVVEYLLSAGAYFFNRC